MPMIRFDQTAYYDWVLTHESDLKPGQISTDSQYEGFRLVRQLIPVETYSESDWEESALARIHYDREQAGLPPASDIQIIIRHYQDAVFPYHFPPDSITKVSCPDNPEWEVALNAVFATSRPFALKE